MLATVVMLEELPSALGTMRVQITCVCPLCGTEELGPAAGRAREREQHRLAYEVRHLLS